MNKRFRAVVSALAAAALFLFQPSIARADIPTIYMSGSFTGTGYSQVLRLGGQSTCSVLTYGAGTGYSITVQGATDLPLPFSNSNVTVTSIGTSGVITTTGAFTGSIAQYATTGIRLQETAAMTGTINYVVSCSPANIPSGGGGGGTVTQGAGNSANPWYTRVCDASTTTNCVSVSASGQLAVVPQASSYTLLTASGNTVVKGSAGTLYGVINLSTATQTVGVTCYDNATTNTGNLLGVNYVSPAFLGPSQVVTFPYALGIAATNGITCNLTGALTATTAIMVLYR